MTVIHIVLFKFRADVDESHRETFVKELKALKTLPCVKDERLVVGGPSITDPIARSKGFQICLLSFHNDKAALAAYQASSEHHRVTPHRDNIGGRRPRLDPPRTTTLRPAGFMTAFDDARTTTFEGLESTLIAVNALVWIAAGIVLHFHPRLISPAALSYVLGLRHALDADHIAAIDLMTRRLIASGQRPATVGTFFSLGHSTIVIVTCIVVAATSGALRERFDGFQHVGNIVGTSVSAAFLIILCIGNGWVLYKLIQRLQGILQERRNQVRLEGFVEEETQIQDHFALEGGGFLTRVFKRLFRVIDRPWKMYPLGVVFGLGFDTSSEIAILGIASIQAVQGTSIWLILIFPILFTAGMCMLDTTDGALMMALYTSKAFSRDVVAILYYSIVLTGITVVVSAFIGIVQVLSLIQNVADPQGRFWDGVSSVGDHFDIVGGSICGVFLIHLVSPSIASMSERKSQDPKGQSSNAVAFINDDDDDKNALNFSIDWDLTVMSPFPQQTFTNPPTYSREETERRLQQAIDLFWADDTAAQQSNVSTNMQNSLQVQTFVDQAAPPNTSAPEQTGSSDHQLGESAYLFSNAQFPADPSAGRGQDQKEESPSTNQTVSEPEGDDSAIGGFPTTVPRISNNETNGTIKPESPVTEAPTPTNAAPTVQNRQQAKTPTATDASVPKSPSAPSAKPNVKPIPQARARGVKRTREHKPSPRAAKRPADRNGNGQPATKKVKPEESNEAKAKPPRYRPITPRIPVPYQQRAFRFHMPSRADFQCLNDPAWLAAHPQAASIWNELLANHRRDQYCASQQARMGIDPRGIASSHSGNIPWSSPMLPQQQLANEMTMGSSPPSPMSSPGQLPTATEDPLPHLNIPMRPGRQEQNSCIDGDPLTTGVTTNHPSLGNLQSLRHPAMYPLNVPGASGYNHTSGNHQTGPRPASSQPNMSAQYSFGPPSGAGLPQFRTPTADELQRRRAHEAALRARFEQNGRR
ncbi:high-affinity nickel-transport protein-domain-containing protein [Fusarium oxysporum]|nr:high-affinity nickel-transport protein-domain-containing protein [Fusarium oxysporum]